MWSFCLTVSRLWDGIKGVGKPINIIINNICLKLRILLITTIFDTIPIHHYLYLHNLCLGPVLYPLNDHYNFFKKRGASAMIMWANLLISLTLDAFRRLKVKTWNRHTGMFLPAWQILLIMVQTFLQKKNIQWHAGIQHTYIKNERNSCTLIQTHTFTLTHTCTRIKAGMHHRHIDRLEWCVR